MQRRGNPPRNTSYSVSLCAEQVLASETDSRLERPQSCLIEQVSCVDKSSVRARNRAAASSEHVGFTFFRFLEISTIVGNCNGP